jgi:enediyne biosynthesis protein E4
VKDRRGVKPANNFDRALEMTRREFLILLATPVVMRGQGMASRGVMPAPRGKPSGIPFLARFKDVAGQAGLTAPTVYGPESIKDYLLETIGCGVAFLDYDNDGWLDIFILCGTRLQSVPADTTNRLYRNNRDGTFTDVTVKAGLKRTGWASAVTVGDYNNDGFEDIFVTYYGENVLYRNNGDGTFTDVTKEAGLRQGGRHWGSGCTFLDYNRDGHLDLFVGNYIDFDLKSAPKPGLSAYCRFKGIPVCCGPRGLETPHNYLFRNNGNGTFTDVSDSAGISSIRGRYSMTAVAADLDDDGWTDIYVACDSTPSLFLRNQHDGTFKEEGIERGVALTEDGMEQAGMGVGIGDADLNGRLDLVKTNFADDTVSFYQNDGGGYFSDASYEDGFGVETRYTNFGVGIFDLDNDGYPDVFISTGSLYPEVGRNLPQYPMATPRLVYRNLGNGKFEELIGEGGPGITAQHCSRGCAFGDFDNDGDIDIVVINMNEPPSLLRNDLNGDRNWLKVLLLGTKSNRSAIGSRVTAHYDGKSQVQTVTAQSSFYSVNDRRLHFGLGKSQTVDLEIRWTNGDSEKFSGLSPNHLLIIQEGRGIVKAEKWTRHS